VFDDALEADDRVWIGLSRSIYERVQFIALTSVVLDHTIKLRRIHEVIPFLRIPAAILQETFDEVSDFVAVQAALPH